MHLADVPLLLLLAGLVFYTVLGGADFGAGLWQLTRDRKLRDHAYHALGPVWEANHVWLIFVLVMTWTAYPRAFGSIASTLSIPLFVAAVGIIFRGTTYALRYVTSADELGTIGALFSISSILTPFALGTAVGGIASRRVPVGNAAGDLVSSWANLTSVAIGVLAVAFGAYMAAVFLSGDAARRGEPELEEAFRRRALGSGLISGALALGSLAVVRSDAHPLFHGLVHGRGLAALIVSVAAGTATLLLLVRRHYETARFSAGLAVAAIVAGWALAQSPLLLPGLTVSQAAAPRDTLIAVVVVALAGALILLPSLGLLFRLYLSGHFDPGFAPALETLPAPAPAALAVTGQRVLGMGLAVRAAGGLLVVGVVLTTFADAAWAHGVGVAALLGFIALAFPAALPRDI
jgi:cytochrome d ubiquinol oxidase subunit II